VQNVSLIGLIKTLKRAVYITADKVIICYRKVQIIQMKNVTKTMQRAVNSAAEEATTLCGNNFLQKSVISFAGNGKKLSATKCKCSC
jgi:hypothetical protein